MTGYRYIKRIIDILLSGLAIIILSPLLLILCIAIKLDSPGPKESRHPQDIFPDL